MPTCCWVGDGLLGSTGTYGATLTHNNSMRPGELGYRPVFFGIANGYARVTLTQGKNTLYSEMVPPGPFSFTDVAVYGSGDVTMTVTEADGRVHTQIFPLSVMADQLSPRQLCLPGGRMTTASWCRRLTATVWVA